jgi:hypothetical protein
MTVLARARSNILQWAALVGSKQEYVEVIKNCVQLI